jgi:spore coat protein U-like protein
MTLNENNFRKCVIKFRQDQLIGRFVKSVLATLIISGNAIYSAESYAAADTNTLAISADVQETCDITTTAVAFGEYDPVVTNASTDLDNTGGKITLVCTAGTTATVILDDGLHENTGSTADAPLRRLSDGTNFINYQLYSDSLGGTVWGGTVATGKVIGTHDGSTPEDMTVYARIPAGQNVPVGSYSDTVQVTASY